MYGCQRNRKCVRFWSWDREINQDRICDYQVDKVNGQEYKLLLTFDLVIATFPLLDLDEFIPFFTAFLIEQALWYPCQEVNGINSILYNLVRMQL